MQVLIYAPTESRKHWKLSPTVPYTSTTWMSCLHHHLDRDALTPWTDLLPSKWTGAVKNGGFTILLGLDLAIDAADAFVFHAQHGQEMAFGVHPKAGIVKARARRPTINLAISSHVHVAAEALVRTYRAQCVIDPRKETHAVSYPLHMGGRYKARLTNYSIESRI